MAKVAQSQIKKKKKIWVPINSPKMFGERKIGETYVYSANEAMGKTIEQNLMILTGDIKKQHITLKFVVDSVSGGTAHTHLISYSMAPSYIKRIVRRRRDKIDYSKVFKTKDNFNVRIKPLIITNTKARGSALTALTKRSQALIASRVSQLMFQELVEEIISFRLQSYVRNNLKSIFPVKSSEIRIFKIEKTGDSSEGVAVEDKTKAEEPKAAEQEQKAEEPVEEKKEE